MNRRFEITGLRFQIAPDEQVVYIQQMTGGTDYLPDGSVIHWDGYEYVPCTEIDFKTTSLIFMGDVITFKEFLPISAEYITSLKIIQHSIGYDKNYATILSPLENVIYKKYPNGYIERVDISGYADIDKLISPNNDKSFVPHTAINYTSLADGIKKGKPQEPLSEWNWFDFFVVGRDNLKGNTVYYPTKNMDMSGSNYYLIKTASGHYGINRNHTSEAVKYDNVMIYNIEKEDYEPIEVEHFRRLTVHFHIYKNHLYNSRSLPVETELDLQKLQVIRLNEEPTEFYTDGTFLVGGYNLGKMTAIQKGKQEWLQFNNIFRDVDWESLQIVSENVMVDKNNIYQTNSSLLEIIPIKDLGLDVKVIPLMNK